MATYRHYRQALEQSDANAAVIVTPTFLHREVACFAAERGKHIFLEKPMALTVAECEAINGAVAGRALNCKLVLCGGLMKGSFAKGMLENGEMGRVMRSSSPRDTRSGRAGCVDV